MSERAQGPSSLGRYRIHPPSVQRLGEGFCRKKQVVVLGEILDDPAAAVTVGMLEPEDRDLAQRLQRFLHREIVPVRLSPPEIDQALEIGFERWKQRADRASLEAVGDAGSLDDAARQALALLEAVIEPAVHAGAEHLHIERRGDGVQVRMRVDARLWPVAVPLSPHDLDGVLARLRALAGLDEDEPGPEPRRGRLSARFGPAQDRRPLELRFAIMPGLDGDEAVLHLVDPQAPARGLGELGLEPAGLTAVQALLDGPAGLVLVAGPAGSGRTTTLHALLRTLDAEALKVVAIEDPVLRRIDGVSHWPIPAGLGFAPPVRAVREHDADVVAIEDLLDAQTMEAAARLAEQGTPVLACLHARDAVAALGSLRRLGVSDELTAEVLRGVIAQRRVPLVCPQCRELAPDDAWSEALFVRMGRRFAHARGRGCERCGGTGQRGRTGIFEVLTIDDAIAEAIASGRGRGELQGMLRASGQPSLLEAAALRAERGEVALGSLRRALGSSVRAAG